MVDRLQPSLLDRLTDEHPGNHDESIDSRVMTAAQLQRAVLRDLIWLLNAETVGADASAEKPGGSDLSDLPHVRRSVLNYGVSIPTGSRLIADSGPAIARAIREAILTFEPRILKDSLVVEPQMTGTEPRDHHELQFSIRGQLWAQPVPLEFLLRTAVDADTWRLTVDVEHSQAMG